MTPSARPVALTIAGSDSGAGAGIQADLKTFAALGVYGTSVITAITAQNTSAVTAVQEVDIEVISAQIDAVTGDIPAAAAKTGMLSSAGIIETVAAGIRRNGVPNLVVDPVMVAASGARLLRADAVEALRTELLRLALVATPNIPEAEVLTGRTIGATEEMREAAEAIAAMGPSYVIVKGGHGEGHQSVDILFDGQGFRSFDADRIDTTSTHGTGCTFSAAIAAGLAKGLDVPDAVAEAKVYVTEAIRSAFPLGSGHGPLNHFFRYWSE